ncbi:hypothetical protein MML48_2g00000184 [Holotrichia oblita]|uniref:Uncharacterized protein n=1 Tax=Holotrichia oblita TaxID=644536 RepID=A0ACB9TID4_HOLOL|nr:hypothetical protein MML48_2g00000184 [Holotrichia oblita]
MRTPTKPKHEDKLDSILTMIKNMSVDQKDIKTDEQKIREEQKLFNEQVMKLQKENENFKKENVVIREENRKIKEELQSIRISMDSLEKERKKNNIVITGLDTDTKEPQQLIATTKSFIRDNLEIEVEIKKALELKEKVWLIELGNEECKNKMMQN